MFGSGISLGRWLGIEVSVDRSWFVIALLLAWSFYTLFEVTFVEMARVSAVLLGLGTAVLFFVSVVLHELSHSLMARRLGIPVEGITLFIFGGVTKTTQEPRTAREEFAIAVVGPVTSIMLAGGFWALVNPTGDIFGDPVRYGFGHLGWINLALGVFNLLPGFPLDGGRVLRSLVWRITGSMERATRTATTGGKIIASLLIGLGMVEVFGGNLGGLWYAAIGWFLFQAAAASGQQMIMRRLFEGMVAADVMSPRLVALSTGTSVQEAVDDYFLRFDHSAFPVQDDDGITRGILTLRAVRQVPRDQWPIIQVWSVMTQLDDAPTVDVDAPIHDVISQLEEAGDHRVLVVEGTAVVGIITSRDIARWVRRSGELGLTEPG